jgi:hypothetical protein
VLVDWRSPAAEPFFGATHANPMGLRSRRRYRWTRGRVSDYWDEVFTSDGLEDQATLDDDDAFTPRSVRAGHRGCVTSWPPSRPTRTPSSGPAPAAPSSSTAVPARARRSSRCTLEFDLVILVDPERFGDGIEAAVDRYVAMTRATQQLVILTSR